MEIKDFQICATPIVECDRTGKVLSLNPAARRLQGLRIGGQLPVRGRVSRLPQGSCLAVESGDRLWLLFCGFLYFDYQGVIFPTAEEYLSLAGEELLHMTAEIARLAVHPPRRDHLDQIRALLYDRFSFLFDRHPQRYCQVGRFLSCYRQAAERTFSGIGARVAFAFGDPAPGRYLNARNAAVLLTELCCFLFGESERGRVQMDASKAGEMLCLHLETDLRQALPALAGGALSELAPHFPARTVELCAADMTARACDYRMEYHSEPSGRLEISVYLQTETDPGRLLDPAAQQDPTGELAKFLAFWMGRQ